MLIEAAAQVTVAPPAPASWPLRQSRCPAESAFCRQRGLRLGHCQLPQKTKYPFTRPCPSPFNCPTRSLPLLFVANAADSTPPASASASAASDKTVVPDEGFSIFKLSFGVIGLAIGGTLLSLRMVSFNAYLWFSSCNHWHGSEELKPVTCITYSDAKNLRETQATPILKQVRDDVTRFRYGDEQHLDEALKRIFQYGLGSGISRRNGPILKMIREEVTEDGHYSLVLVFEAKALQLSDFEQRQSKFASFFGPGITAEIGKGEDNDLFEVRLISQTAQ